MRHRAAMWTWLGTVTVLSACSRSGLELPLSVVDETEQASGSVGATASAASTGAGGGPGATSSSSGASGGGPPCVPEVLTEVVPWNRRAGDALSQEARSVAVGRSGAVAVAGYFESHIDFGCNDLVADSVDVFVAMLDDKGNALWSKRYGDAGFSHARSIALDATEAVVVGGHFTGSIDFGGDALVAMPDDQDGFLAKLAPDGGHVWSHRVGAPGSERLDGVAVDTRGAVIAVGLTQGGLDFGDGPLPSGALVVKLDANGDHLWSRTWGPAVPPRSGATARSVAIGPDDSVVVAGDFADVVDFGGGPVAATGELGDIFLVKLAADGSHVWTRTFANELTSPSPRVAIDAAGSITLVGAADGVVDLGGGPAFADHHDAFVVRLDESGDHVWSKLYGDDDAQVAHAVALDGSSNVVFTVSGGGTLDFGGGPFISGSSYLVKLAADGSHVWSTSFAAPCVLFGLAIDHDDNPIAVGQFAQTIQSSAGPLASAGGWDVLVTKRAP